MDAMIAVCDLYRSELDEAVALLRDRGLLASERSSQLRRTRSRNSRVVSETETQSFAETTQRELVGDDCVLRGSIRKSEELE